MGPRLRRRLLLGLFDQLYTRLAWAYDLAALVAGAGYWYRWVEEALAFVDRGPVLEIGFGRGHLLPLLRARGLTLIGLDASAQMVRHAAGHHPAVVQGQGQALPFPERSFAAVVTTFPAPFVTAAESQHEIARVLQPDGVWVWVDAPRLEWHSTTVPSSLLTRALDYQPARSERGSHLVPGLWHVTQHRPRVGASTICVMEMRKTGAS